MNYLINLKIILNIFHLYPKVSQFTADKELLDNAKCNLIYQSIKI